jgi:hypothetical protein
MANLTITISDALLRRARIRALEQGTSLNALLRSYIEAYADGQAPMRARAALFALARASRAGSGKDGRRWTRDELHER